MSKFEQLGLEESLLKAIADLGYENPTPVQEESIPQLLKGDRDCVSLAQTGTGKTAAFGLPLLQLMNPMSRDTQAIILAPTRELCMQIHNDLKLFSKYSKIEVVAVYGGAAPGPQIRAIKNGAQIIVATPGRLIDYIEKGIVKLETIERIVLDEADEMLNMGFLDDINYILKNAENKETIWLFSATMPTDIKRISKKFMKDPIEVAVNSVNSTNVNIDHQYFVTTPQKRFDTLKRIIDFSPEMYGIIFTRTKNDAKFIADMMIKNGYKSDALHGDLSQDQRDVVMNRFRSGSLKLLIATDVAARGIDVSAISHVINYELPDDPEVYTHRSGRTGRAGLSGICLSIVQSREIEKIRRIERMCKTKFNRRDIPSGSDIVRKKLFFNTEQLINEEAIPQPLAGYKDYINEQLVGIEKEDLLMKFLSLMLKDDFKKYQHAPDLNLPNYTEISRTGDRTSIFINIGSKDGFDEASFKEWIESHTEVAQDLIYRVHIRELVSFFDIETSTADFVIDTLNKQKLKNRKIRVDKSERQPTGGRSHSGSRSNSSYRSGGSSGSGGNSEGRKRSFKPAGAGSSRPKYQKKY